MTLGVRDRSRAAGLAPFAAAALVAWFVSPIGSRVDWSDYVAATAMLVVPAVLAYMSAAGRLKPAWGQLPASLAFMAAVGLLRSSDGGTDSGIAAIALIPVFYTALYSPERRHMYVILGALTAFYVLPIILAGPPPSPYDQYRAGLLMLVVSSIVGLTTQRLVAHGRHQAAEAYRRERMIEQVSHAVRRLLDSEQPRTEVCHAVRATSGADAAMLLEPGENGALVCTGAAGLRGAAVPPVPGSYIHPAHTVFHTGLPRLVFGDVESTLGYRDLWEACGRPESVLYQPLMRDGDVAGVLVAAWSGPVKATGPRATVIGLLAHEAALAIGRADELSALSDMAQTDPLTGLPNRRAWDARVSRAVSEGQQVTIAMFDLDHFKLFNDSYGHPAGDRLLKETAAAWRDTLRAEDLVARLGGEEFGFLLFDCDLQAAVALTERLRRLVTHGQTCSVGIAVRSCDEAVDAVMARVDRALYDAKASGRDRACMSV